MTDRRFRPSVDSLESRLALDGSTDYIPPTVLVMAPERPTITPDLSPQPDFVGPPDPEVIDFILNIHLLQQMIDEALPPDRVLLDPSDDVPPFNPMPPDFVGPPDPSDYIAPNALLVSSSDFPLVPDGTNLNPPPWTPATPPGLPLYIPTSPPYTNVPLPTDYPNPDSLIPSIQQFIPIPIQFGQQN